ncbi:Uncharacterized protein GBIM_05968 [Gryllus bimaculatus]|nr:Uncharacterized protein GBIM_05968 [Gryllus bimaculatus]
MAEISELRMNVAALKRVDPYVKEILGTATHVALYTFNAEANEWERTDVEGALFVYSRNGEPFHGILIMNRLNTHNLVEPVVQGLEMQLQEPFLLYRNTRCRIFGIWFYDKDQCTRIATMLDKLVKDLDIQKKMPDKTTVRNKSVTSGPAGVDIFSMLNKAQEDYNSNKVPDKIKSVTEVKPAPHEDVPSKSVMDFFAKATSNVSHFNVHNAPHPPGINLGHSQRTALVQEVGDNRLKPLLQRLMSNPAHSVEHIEKQQRSATPRSDNANDGKEMKREIKILNGNGFKVRPLTLPGSSSAERVGGTEPVEVLQPKSYAEQAPNTSTVENSMNFLRIASPSSNATSLAPFFGPVVQPTASNGIGCDTTPDQRSSSAPAYNTEASSKLALMPPTMFTSSVSKETNNIDVASNSAKSELSVPLMPTSSLGSDDGSCQIRPEPLTKKQLLQAFNYLIKNDADFMTKLHEAYVKSFADIVHS